MDPLEAIAFSTDRAGDPLKKTPGGAAMSLRLPRYLEGEIDIIKF